jgi:TrmH family RNA methyltransferase
MLNFGFTSLRLIEPLCSPADEEARNRAKHAGAILDDCQIYDGWDSALSDISVAIGTSGKRESGEKTLFRHFIQPWELAEKIDHVSGKVALIFGEEGMGLSTDELQQCDMLMTIPTWEGYPICNLSHAVALSLYELNRSIIADGQVESGDPLAQNLQLTRAISPDMRRLLRNSIDEFAAALDGDENKRAMVADNLRRTILRGLPIDNEAQRLIGAFVEATTALQKLADDARWRNSRRRRLDSGD